MTAGELIRLIPEETFQRLAVETKVDRQVKQLSGEVIFKLILFSMLNSNKLSLRVMETYLQSASFKSFAGYGIIIGKYNSIRDRICTINADYFEKLFTDIFSIYNKELQEEKSLSITDSTCVSLAAKLLSDGMRNSKVDTDDRYLKYSVYLKGSIPASVKIFKDQSYICDDKALTELINDTPGKPEEIIVFDRAVRTRSTFDKFTTDKRQFVTRSKLDIRCNTAHTNILRKKPFNSTVTIQSDETGYLSSGSHKRTEHQYRVIKAIIDKSQEPICFVTNMLQEDAYMIAGCYKQRWKIEVFFKFIKQHLNVKHLVSRDENGIKVMLYMTMILATLIIAYKKINGIKGFKIAKLKFEIDLDNEMIKQIVILCGGDPAKATHLFNST